MVYRKGSRDIRQFPSMFALIRHPTEGYILFDTGYSSHFLESTAVFPYSLYAKVTPVHLGAQQSAREQLLAKGIAPADIRYVFISHFHGDHVSAMKDFPRAQYICMRHGYEFARSLKGIWATRQGVLPALFPADFEERAHLIDWKQPRLRIAPVFPFEYTFDLFEDGTLLVIPLDGHFKGQAGLYIPSARCFLVADACWLSKSYQDLVYPHPIAMQIMNNAKQYKKDLRHLQTFHQKNPDISIVPSHCSEAIAAFQNRN